MIKILELGPMKSIGHKIILWWVIAGFPLVMAFAFFLGYYVNKDSITSEALGIYIIGIGFWAVLLVYQIFLSRLMTSKLDADHY